ncbi:MAG: dihydroneopterin aldolase [Ectothiorhodospiraceae bacterium]|nr:dihydroneopterin aldolase [Ectothiorhodospiraceae bacterium]
MDIIFLHDLTIETIIGIYDWERKEKQSIVLDLDMGADIAAAAQTDAIEDTLNYKAVAKRLIDFVGDSEFQLVETLAERVADIVLTEFEVKWVRLRVNKKGAVRYAGDVGVVIERGVRQGVKHGESC